MREVATLLYILLTLAAYVGIRRLYLRYNSHPLLNVVVLSAAIVIAVLVIGGIPYESYAPAKDIMTILLGPATVGLALPLYRYRHLLRQYAAAIVSSVALGALLAMFLAGAIAKLGGLPEDVVMSILPKGVSIPFAIEVAHMHNGIPALAAAFVVATGTLGSLVGTWSLTAFGIRNPMARGLALILAGILTAAFSPLVVWVLRFIPAL